MKQRWVLVVSVIVGLVAFWLTQQYFRAKLRALAAMREAIEASAQRVGALAVGRDLPVGSVLKRDDLKWTEILKSEVGRNVILTNDIEDVIGKKTTINLLRGDTLFWSYLDVPFRPGAGLASMINERMRAVSISVSGSAAVSGLVQPNDRVDILGTFYFPSKTAPQSGEMEVVTLTLLQDVTVLAVGQTLAKQTYEGRDRRAAQTGYSTVTLEVSPREAELLVFAETMKGRLTLSLRNPADVSYEENLPPVDFEHVEKKIQDLNAIRQREIRHKRGT